MRKYLKRICGVFAIIILSAFMAVSLATRQTSAIDGSMSSTVVKWLFAQYYNCVQSPSPTAKIDMSKLGGKKISEAVFSSSSPSYPLPSKDVFGVGAESLSCSQTLEGAGGKLDGILQAGGKSWNTKISDLGENYDILEKLGYRITNGEKVSQVSLKMVKNNYKTAYKLQNREDFQDGDFAKDGNESNASTAVIKITQIGTGALSPVVESKTGDMAGLFTYTIVESPQQKLVIEKDNSLATSAYNVLTRTSVSANWNTIEIPFGNSVEQFATNAKNALNGKEIIVDKVVGVGLIAIERTKYKFNNDVQPIVDSMPGSVFEFPVGDKKTAALYSMQQFGHPVGSIALTEDEIYSLYAKYLEKVFGTLRPSSNSSIECNKSEGYERIPLKSGSGWTNYYFKMDGINTGEQFNIYEVSGDSVNFTTITLNDIISWMRARGGSATDDESCNDPAPTEEYDTTMMDPATEDVNCFNAGGALGWILCPIISFVRDTITAIYSSIATNFLDINATYYEISSESAVYKAWQVFQSFANIIFVIVFLITIFSQVTGFGIDNLGIKRILPKLIVAAILINLSYIICLLAMDLSNILGVGLNSLFGGIAVAGNGQNTAAAALSTGVTMAVAGAVLLLGPGTGLWGATIIIPLFLGLLTTLFGVLFFFVILGVRQALIVIFVAISPIAFACYMLPNTKRIFDKWFKIFEGLLLVYPICGALMGGSAFASKVLQALDSGFLGQLIAMLVGVVPFFFIPTILRNSMNAVGNIGARISSFGQGMGRRITGSIANSDTTKEMQLRMNAGVDANGNANWLGRRRMQIAEGKSIFSKIPGMQRAASRTSARARGAYAKYLSDQMREQNLNSPDFFRKYQESQAMSAEKDTFNAAVDVLNKATNKGEIFAAERDENGNLKPGQTLGVYDYFTDALGRSSSSDAGIRSAALTDMKAATEISGRASYSAGAFWKQIKDDSTAGKFNDEAIKTIAKQITTGDNSKTFRSTDALGYEYMAQVNSNSSNVRNADGSIMSYGDWASKSKNVHDALEHHVAEAPDLVNQSSASLNEIHTRLSSSPDLAEDRKSVAALAELAMEQGKAGNIKYDRTKIEGINKLGGMTTRNVGRNDARPGETFTIHQANGAPVNIRMTMQRLEGWGQQLQGKVDNRTATKQDYQNLKEVNREIERRRNNGQA